MKLKSQYFSWTMYINTLYCHPKFTTNQKKYCYYTTNYNEIVNWIRNTLKCEKFAFWSIEIYIELNSADENDRINMYSISIKKKKNWYVRYSMKVKSEKSRMGIKKVVFVSKFTWKVKEDNLFQIYKCDKKKMANHMLYTLWATLIYHRLWGVRVKLKKKNYPS